MKKLLNPFTWLINLFMYLSHLETQRHVPSERYEPYDFSRDIKPF